MLTKFSQISLQFGSFPKNIRIFFVLKKKTKKSTFSFRFRLIVVEKKKKFPFSSVYQNFLFIVPSKFVWRNKNLAYFKIGFLFRENERDENKL